LSRLSSAHCLFTRLLPLSPPPDCRLCLYKESQIYGDDDDDAIDAHRHDYDHDEDSDDNDDVDDDTDDNTDDNTDDDDYDMDYERIYS
jgi:hypothetical protein